MMRKRVEYEEDEREDEEEGDEEEDNDDDEFVGVSAIVGIESCNGNQRVKGEE